MAQAKKQDFEKQMERLQAVVAELEKGELSLEKNVTLYKEGLTLVKSCRDQLEKARHTVRIQDGETLKDMPEREGEDS